MPIGSRWSELSGNIVMPPAGVEGIETDQTYASVLERCDAAAEGRHICILFAMEQVNSIVGEIPAADEC